MRIIGWAGDAEADRAAQAAAGTGAGGIDGIGHQFISLAKRTSWGIQCAITRGRGPTRHRHITLTGVGINASAVHATPNPAAPAPIRRSAAA